ncbi:hypothetical protein ACJ41O_010764 [Fusarium nematophilum]
MPGVPHVQRCDQCRKAKKKCNQAQPSCERCHRIGIPCTGANVQRYKFINSAVVPRNNPYSESASVARGFVSILEDQDVRYDLSFLGPFFAEIPQRLDSSKVLTTSVSALSSTYRAIRVDQSRTKALSPYGDALKALRNVLRDEAEAETVNTVCAIYITMVCQECLLAPDSSDRAHIQMIQHLIGRAIKGGWLQQFDRPTLATLLACIVWECVYDPSITLEPWFHDLLAEQQKLANDPSLHAVNLVTIAQIRTFMDNPDSHQADISSSYELVQADRRAFRIKVDTISTAAAENDAPRAIRIGCAQLLVVYAIIIVVEALLNRILRRFGDDDGRLTSDVNFLCDEIMEITRMAAVYRPFGAGYMQEAMVSVWSTMEVSTDRLRLETFVLNYWTDATGLRWMAKAKERKKHLDWKLGSLDR